MKTTLKVTIFYIAATLLLAGTLLYITKWEYAPYLFAVGSACVATFFLTTPYEGTNFRVKRLHRFEIIASILLLVTSYFMFKHRTEWIMTLSIASFLLLYSSIITTIEEKKDK